ncbi:flavodoxin family protein [Nanoarchaeota archaeon]
MKVLVAYHTITGNTKKIAEAIFETIDTEKEIKKIDLSQDLDEGYDLYFLGFPMMNFGPNEPSKKFLQENTKGKKIVLFVTHGSPEEVPHLQDWLNNFKNAVSESELIGMFNCSGKCSQAMLDVLRASGNPEYIKWADGYVPNNLPDEKRVQKAKDFTKEIMEKFK